MTTDKQVGNVLGAPRAEIDTAMLTRAFVETADYRALITTTDFNFVVGRRGTGKTALFLKSFQAYTDRQPGLVLAERPEEHDVLLLRRALEKSGQLDYRTLRAIGRITWRAALLVRVAHTITLSPVSRIAAEQTEAKRLLRSLNPLPTYSATRLAAEILNDALTHSKPGEQVHHSIVEKFHIPALETLMRTVVQAVRRPLILLFDGLDEGWSSDVASTAVIGSLALAVADFADKQVGIHGMLFVRDNMFRALASLDADFSRHIEGNSVRLRWDKDSLLHLVAKRIRIFLGLEGIESDIRVWNRFAHRDIKDRDGFDRCLKLTLYRPRDLLVLLNRAFQEASRAGREEIIWADVESTAETVSRERLADLVKEYEQVLPGLELLLQGFQHAPAFANQHETLARIAETIASADYSDERSSDFALLGTPAEAFSALYGIGFLGIESPTTREVVFCHDGARVELGAKAADARVILHPCYWKALDIDATEGSEDIVVKINDEYAPVRGSVVQEQRVRLIGQIVSEFPAIAKGHDGASAFEEWVLRVGKTLFAGKLKNFELKPNGDAIQRRDLVATNSARDGFWHRILTDYGCRQVVFEIKNYDKLKPEDFRQAALYAKGEYGKLVVVVTRSEIDALSESERGWLKEVHAHEILVFVIHAPLLVQAVSKMRRADKHDWIDEQLEKRLDRFVRSYLSLRHHSEKKAKRRARK